MKNVNMWASDWGTDGISYWPKDAIESEGNPSTDETLYFPVINEKRVRGSRYTPYTAGSTEWREAANRTLADRGRANFENGKH